MIERITKAIRDICAIIGEIPDHITALFILLGGVIATCLHQHDIGASLTAAGLAMWKGKQ